MICNAPKLGLDRTLTSNGVKGMAGYRKNTYFPDPTQNPQALGQLVSGVAHDFNQVLQAILGYAGLCLDEFPKDSASYRHIGKVLSSAERGEKLVKQILDSTRPPNRTSISTELALVLSEAMDLLTPVLDPGIEIQTDLAPDCPPLAIDSTEMVQVFLNLCANASHAMEREGGTLSIRSRRVDIADTLTIEGRKVEPGQYVQLLVSDTGEGMDEETLQRIFEPYYTTKGRGQGTGLGLSTVQEIIRKHEGLITVTSARGKGSTFLVLLPTFEENIGGKF